MSAQQRRRLAVVGGGWAGLAAAVAATQQGWQVSLYEMAGQLGGRARSLADTPDLDNGQHILIGAYQACLGLMRTVGVDTDAALLRQPLQLRYPDLELLQLPAGPALPAFARGVLASRAWPLAARLQLLLHCGTWLARRFRCPPALSVAELCARLPTSVQLQLINPLCIAALNTPASHASAQVFLRVLKDAVFSGPGAADLLLPRRPLSALLAEPAQRWLEQQGALVRLGQRVNRLEVLAEGWQVDNEPAHTALILACTAAEAARLVEPHAPAWSQTARGLRYEPIITVYLDSPGSRLTAPMLALHEDAQEPAQFAFDLGQLGQAPGRFAFVISGAAAWVERGLDATGQAVLIQVKRQLCWTQPPRVLRVLAEKRATFACVPGLRRPAPLIATGLCAAGDYIDGPYPATLEGAVRSGQQAVDALRQPYQGLAKRRIA